jgi:DNA-binding MarR family transcriptional regulator
LDEGPRGFECVLSLLRAEGLLSGELAALLRRHRLSVTSFHALVALREARSGLSPHQIGERLGVTRATVTGVLDGLEERALVIRRGHPGDRRRLVVELTDQGVSLLGTVQPAHHRSVEQMLRCLSSSEKATLIRLLGRLHQGLLERRAEAT